MLCYFTRLLLNGVISGVLSLITLYTVVSYTPGGPAEIVQALTTGDGHPVPPNTYLIELIPILELDRPWPINSLAWLFDPTESERFSRVNGNTTKGIYVVIAGVPIQGSGVLTGDLGESLIYQPGTPVMDIIGRRTDEYLLAHLAAIFAAMIIAYAQRRGRPRLHELSSRLLPHLATKRRAVESGVMQNGYEGWPHAWQRL